MCEETEPRVSEAVEILDRMVGEDEGLRAMIAEEGHKLAIAQIVYDARQEAGLTQQGLAALIGTRQPVIARLENADYGPQSLTMLHRIAKALGKRLEVSFVPSGDQKDQPQRSQAARTPSRSAERRTRKTTPAGSYQTQGGG